MNIACYMVCLISLLIFLSQCAPQKGNDCLIISGIDNNPIDCPLSGISSDISYVKLDSKVLIDQISKVQICSDKIILKAKSVGILAYDLNGNFISRIGGFGNGPGEYTKSFSTFTANSKGTLVYILDHYNKIFVYSSRGIFQKSFNLNDSILADDIFGFPDNQLLLVEGNSFGKAKFNWVITDSTGNTKFQKRNYIKFSATRFAGPSPENIVISNAGSFIYFEQYNDTIFQVSPNSYRNYAIFKFNDIRLTPEISGKEGPIGAGNKYFLPLNIFRLKDDLFFQYFFNLKINLAKFDSESQKLRVINSDSKLGCFTNDIDGGLPFDLCISSDQILLGWFSPFQLKAHVASEAFKNSTPKYPEKKKALEKLANSLNENDNPVLMLVKLKE